MSYWDLTHIDIDDVFDWMRVELRECDWLGIDIPDGSARCDGKVPNDIKQGNTLDAEDTKQNEQ